jgi:type IV pilus assembly protein PilW
MALRAHRRAARRESGFTLVEILVGVVIALIAVLVIFQVFAVSEGIKRNTTGIGDAQQTGLFASFALGQEIINAGSGVATAIQELNSCPDTGDIATTQRPISVVITDSGSIDKPDSMVINYAVSARLVVPATFTRNSAPGDDFWIQSPNGILVGDRIVAVAPNSPLAGQCAVATVTAVGAPDGLGVVQVSYTPAAGVTFSQNSVMFNYGPAASAQRVRYDVSADTLRSLDLYNAAAAPVPLASNIANLKLQYGIDTDNNGYLDTWVSATGAWAPDQVLVAPAEKLNQIKAVRMAIVVRSEQFDKAMGDWKPPQPLFTDCGAAACPAPLDITIPAVVSPPGNFRYRVYENVVPIRNGIWNFVKG